MRAHVFLLLAALVGAGCLGNATSDGTPAASREGLQPSVIVDPATIEPDAAPVASAPVWAVGDAWTITTHGGSEEQAVLVVTAADADAYILDTTSDDMASWEAMTDVSYLGRIRASDLAGHQQDQPVQYFSFPLEDGKSWTTRWDGMEITITATKSARGFDLVGMTSDGAAFVTYDYVPDLKWWGHIEFAEGYGFRVERFTSEWKGEVARATSNLLFEATSTGAANAGSGAFTVSEGQSFAIVTLSGGGEAWARGFTLVQPDGTPYMTGSHNAEVGDGAGGYFVIERLPPTPGEWRISAPTLHDATGSAEVRVHEVGISKVAFG